MTSPPRHTAAVHRKEAEARRETQPEFAAVLDTWAIAADLRADEQERTEPPDMFSYWSEE